MLGSSNAHGKPTLAINHSFVLNDVVKIQFHST